MIIDYNYTKPNNLEISYVNQDGERELKSFHYEPYKWIQKSKNARKVHPKFKSWDGFPVKKVKSTYPGKYTIWEFLESIKDKHPEIFEVNMPKMHFADIEVISDEGFPDPYDAKHPVVSIALHNENNHCFTLGLKDLSTSQCNNIEKDVNEYFSKFEDDITFSYRKFNSERELLAFFLYKIMPKITLLTGWNFVHFDWKYIYRRAKKLGLDVSKSSVRNQMHYAGNRGFSEPVHTSIIDYQQLFSKYDYSIQIKENEKLDWVSEEVLDLNKLKYNGSLQELYAKDFEKFIKYNVIDTILVRYIHQVLDCFSTHALLSIIAGGIKLKDADSPVAMTEVMLLPELRKEYNYLFTEPSADRKNQRGSYEGGWVKEIEANKYYYVACFDFSSLYPSLIRMFNISPEAYLGKISDMDSSHFENFRTGELTEFDPDKHIKTVIGAIFTKEDSILRKKLAEYYNRRKTYQKQMYTAEANIDLIKRVKKSRMSSL